MKLKIVTAPPTHPDGVTIGEGTADKAGFHGSAVVQRAGAAQAAVPAAVVGGAAGANPTQAEYAVAVAQINALTVLVNELRAAVVEKGIIKGAA